MPFFRDKDIRFFITASFLLIALVAISTKGNCNKNRSLNRIKTVVIDPGHGGKDPGTIWGNGRYKEKDIVLQVSLRLGEMIKSKYPDVRILYTRTTDRYLELSERSNFANRNKADIFISIHVNATKATSVSGTETFVMGTHKSESNFELCKAENSVIVLEENYQSKYEGFDPNSPESYIIFSLLQNTHLEQSLRLAELMQQEYRKGPIYSNRGVKQGGLIVLWRSTMPAVLTEIGFLSNTKDRGIIVTKEGQRKIASNIFKAFSQYKEEFESGGTTKHLEPQPAKRDNEKRDNEYYSIQILSVSKILKSNAPDLKGRKDYTYIKAGNTYKYMIGKYRSREEASKALKSIKQTFKGAFIINVSGGNIIH